MRLIRSATARLFAGMLLAFWALDTGAFWAPTRPELPNFDRRSVGADRTAAAERTAAVEALRAMVPSLQIHFDERLGTPKWIVADRGFLSGPGGKGNGIRPQTTATFGTNEDYLPPKAFLTEHRSLF